MDSNEGGNSPYQQQSRQSAAEAARQKVLAVYSSATQSLQNHPTDNSSEDQDFYTPEADSQTPASTNDYYPSSEATNYYSDNSTAANAYNATNSYDAYDQTYNSVSQPSTSYTESTSADYYNSQSDNYYDQNQPSYTSAANIADFSETYIPDESVPWAADSVIYTQNHSNYNQYSADNAQNVNQNPTNYNQSVAAQQSSTDTSADNSYNDPTISQDAIDREWKQYHSAWQDYYRQYYENYYSNAAQTYIQTEKLKDQRIASGQQRRKRHAKRLIPIFIIIGITVAVLFLQYNRLIFAPIMAYISPDTNSAASSIEAIDPNITQAVSAEPRLIIPKLNIDVPVAFGINYNDVMEAMNHGVAQFMIPGANAMPGQIGNLVISGHSAGDIYSSNPYKFIFSGLERLQAGDLIYVNYESVRYTYQMTHSEVVEPTNVQALIYQTDKPMLTLITCTPLGTSRYRLLITAEQISPSYEGNSTETPPAETPDQDYSMPANSPSLFENIWSSLFGN